MTTADLLCAARAVKPAAAALSTAEKNRLLEGKCFRLQKRCLHFPVA